MVNIADTVDCLVIETYAKLFLVNINEHLYELLEVDPYSIKCNTEEKTERKRRNYTPPLSHHWKKFSFDQYLKRKRYKSQGYEYVYPSYFRMNFTDQNKFYRTLIVISLFEKIRKKIMYSINKAVPLITIKKN